MSSLRELAGDLIDGARDALAARGATVAVKTNFGPELTLYQAGPGEGAAGGEATAGGFSLAQLLGLKAAVIVRDAHGRVLYATNPPPATEPLRATAAAVLVVLLAFFVVRGILK